MTIRSHSRSLWFATAVLSSACAVALSPNLARAGYEAPSYIDGCRSADGRFEITARCIERGKTSHGPNKWVFVWKDLVEDKLVELPARGVQGGQTRGQLFIAPDGKTFAYWNHITMNWAEKSHMHASSHGDVVKRENWKWDEYRQQPIFTNRLIVYRNDGAMLTAMHIHNFLLEDEWQSVLPVFNRIEWLRPYNNLQYKNMTRTSYAFTKVSPDYTVLEFQVGDRKNPRPVRVSLTTGTLIPLDQKLPEEKTPVMMVDARHLPKPGGAWGEAYIPSLDPVRQPGRYRIDTIEEAFPGTRAPKKLPDFETGQVKQIADGFAKADTPSWLDRRGKRPDEAARLIFTDLEADNLYTLFPENEKTELRSGTTRGRVVNGRTFVGLVDGKISSWDPHGKSEPEVLLDREVSLNDLAVSARGLIYFTTLKDPEKGRLSVLDPETGKLTVLFDGEDHPTLANPNGIALSKNERFLYVGISNYKSRKHSGIYAFPIKGDGTIDLDSGKAKPRIPIRAPDGIATDRSGNIYFTAGNTVHIYTPFAKPLGEIKIPRGSGTNLCFGGKDRFAKTLFVTTREAIYAIETPFGGK